MFKRLFAAAALACAASLMIAFMPLGPPSNFLGDAFDTAVSDVGKNLTETVLADEAQPQVADAMAITQIVLSGDGGSSMLARPVNSTPDNQITASLGGGAPAHAEPVAIT